MGRSRRRRLGQHFLTDRRVVRRIVTSLRDEPSRIVEIGPGRGALTDELVERFRRVLVLEADEGLAGRLSNRLSGAAVEVRLEDGLSFDIGEVLGQEAPWQLVSNLPYSVGTAILRRLLPRNDVLTRMVVMLQREVARRIVAEPGEREHGLMALERAAYAEASIAFHVPPTAFRPRPRVMSSVVVLDLKPPAADPDLLGPALKLAGHALNQRRKMVANALRPLVEREQVEAAGLDPQTRPGNLSLDDWLKLARTRM